MNVKFGLKPFQASPRDLLFAKYRTGEPLAPHPAAFGHENLIADWQMLGNDAVGDCVFAGAAHETMLWSAIGGKPAAFTTQDVLSDYSALTGYDPNDPSTDQGTDMRQAADYRKNTGIMDAAGVRHKIGAYLFIDPRNYDQFLEAIWLFGAVGLGIKVPRSAMDQFNSGAPWHVAPFFDWSGRQILGGHYVPAVADRSTPVIVTWGKIQQMNSDFYTTYVDSAVTYVSEEMLTRGKSPEGFDLTSLQNDLNQLQT